MDVKPITFFLSAQENLFFICNQQRREKTNKDMLSNLIAKRFLVSLVDKRLFYVLRIFSWKLVRARVKQKIKISYTVVVNFICLHYSYK